MAQQLRRRSVATAFISLLLVVSKFDSVMTQGGAASCPSGFTYVASVNGCYKLILQKLMWQNATQTCASLASGAHLAFIGSVNEDQAISTIIQPNTASGTTCAGSEWFLGGQRIDPSYRSDIYWKYSESSGPVAGLEYSNWNGGQPDYYGNNEQCATIQPAWGNRWNDLTCATSTCSVCEVDVPLPNNNYCITVYTSNFANAATQAKVFITLRGDTNSSEYNLYNSAIDSFAQGQVSKFCLPIPSVGTLTGITVRHDNTGGAPGWFLDKVVVEDSTQKYTFPAYRWLAVDDNDKLTSVDLTLGHNNLALLKRTWQSTTWGLWGSSRAVDGVKDRMARDLGSCSSTQNEMNAWWVVDLGKPAFVHSVQITTRADGGGNYDSNMLVGLTNAPPKPTSPVPVPLNYYLCNNGPVISKLAEYIYVLCEPAANQPSTRYVVVQLNQTSSYLTLCEVEVFGTIDTSACNSNPCLNGGTCYSQPGNSFACSCAVGYSGPTCATPGCPDGFTYFSGVNGCYRLIVSNQGWANSSLACSSYAAGAHLAIVSSDLEQQAINSLVSAFYVIDSSYTSTDLACSSSYFGLQSWWLAGQRQDPKANTPFVWRTYPSNTSTPVVYTNWNGGQPDYCCGGESCMTTVQNWGFNWNDAPCDTVVYCGICEYDLPTATVVNLALKQPTMMSSVYAPWGSVSISSRAVDGNKNAAAEPGTTGSCFATSNEMNAWWAVDVGIPAFVQGVQLVVRKDCCPDQAANVYIGLTNIAPSSSTPPMISNYDFCARGPLTTNLNDVFMVQCATNLPASRYVIVQRDGPNHVTLCEVEVYGRFVTGPCATMPCQNGGTCTSSGASFTCACAVGFTGDNCTVAATNLALSKTAVQSSTYATYVVGRGNDGNPSTDMGTCSSTNTETNPWWSVDLVTPTFIQGVKFLIRNDGAASNQNSFVVGLTNMDPALRKPHPTSYTVGVCGNGPVNTVAGQAYWVRCAPNQPSARYVVIQLEKLTSLAVCELFVYGQADSGACASQPCLNGGQCKNAGSSYTCSCATGFTGATCATAARNLALNRPAWASSTYSTWQPGLITDGGKLTTAGQCAATNDDWSAWFATDLGSQAYVQGVSILNRGDCCGTTLSQVSVGLTNVPPTQNLPDPTNYAICGYGPTLAAVGEAYLIKCAANLAPSRFVVVQLPTTTHGYLTICELEVYGTTDSSSCLSNPCRNGGTCTGTSGGFTCTCFAGWTGSSCETAALNIARGQPALQGSTYGTWIASKAVDGNRANCWGDAASVTSTLAEPHPWWSVDLGQPTYVQGVLYVMSTAAYVGDPTSVITIGLTNKSPALRAPTPGGYEICGTSISAQVGSAQIYILCTPNQPPHRYVIVQFEKSDYLRVCELEVYNNQGPCGSNPCQNGGNCTNAGVGFTCVCGPGFSGSDCSTRTDPCASSPCANGGVCTASTTSFTYTCACASGWTGTNCQTKVDPCASSPCANGGVCTASTTSFAYTCACASGWTGTNCQTKVDPCASSPCANGGVCTASTTSFAYTCACASGWTGTNCQTKVDPCASSPCANGGVCTASTTSFTYTCACASGWTGTNCQTKVDPCANSPCANGGVCTVVTTSSSSTYTCTCASGWTGTNCQTRVDPCANSPCANGGVCTVVTTSSSSTYTCTCASGWTGTNCQTKVDPCASSPCANGGVCTASTTSFTYTCACTSGWTGTNCQTSTGPINVCLVSNPCKNGGKCNQLGDGYYCLCPPGYTGMSCELDDAACLAMSDNTRLNCGFGGVTQTYCHNVSCCFDASAPTRNQAACFFSKSLCANITPGQRVDCYKGNPVAQLFCNQRGCCWDSTAPATGLRCFRAAARHECIGVPASKRIPLNNPQGTPNDCESRGGCWDSSVRDQPSLWCFTIAP